MPMVFECPSCGKKLKIPDELVGKQVRCSDCAGTFVAERPRAAAPPRRADDAGDERRPRSSDTESHRGVLVMCFGIISIVLLFLSGGFYVGAAVVGPVIFAGPPVTIVGLVLGILAWIWGGSDLARMKHGFMDPSGHGMTMAGYVCGIIGTILNAFSLIAACVALVAALAGVAAFGCCIFSMFNSQLQRMPAGPPPPPRRFEITLPAPRLADYLPARGTSRIP